MSIGRTALFLSALVVIAGSANAITVCFSGCDYSSIQSAIGNTSPDDTIEVQSGTYHENVKVNKQLTLKGVDTGGGQPVIDGGGSGNVVEIKADNVTFDGFKVTHSGNDKKCVNVEESDRAVIKNNTVTGCGYGIYLDESNYSTLENNTVENNEKDGIKLYKSNNNTLLWNTADRNKNGIRIDTSSNNTLAGNTARFNNWSTKIGGHGIYIRSNSRGNLLYLNNLTDNNQTDAWDTAGGNQWDNGTLGNHYSDYDESSEGCEDYNGNGICDESYSIPGSGGSVDNYPLTSSSLIPPVPELSSVVLVLVGLAGLLLVGRHR